MGIRLDMLSFKFKSVLSAASWTIALLFLQVILVIQVQAQQPTPTPSSLIRPTPTPAAGSNSSVAISTTPLNTTYTSIYATTLLPGQPRPSGVSTQQSVFLTTATITSIYPTSTITPSSSSSSATPAKATGPPPETGLPLHTNLDPAFGIFGGLLIISGIILSFIGHRSRWLICLLCGFYTLSLVTLCIILRVGVSRAVNDPSISIKGLYLLACVVAGFVGGGLFVIFRNGGLLLSSGLGGFTLALFLQACKSNGMIQTVGIRYILYILIGTISFALACHSKMQPYVLIFSSALIGVTAFTLGIDCFTKSNLKEFYIRNIGFDDIFEAKYPDEFHNHRWFLSTASVIELGVIAGVTIMGIAFQSKMWSEFRTSLLAMKNSDEERHLQAKAKRATKKILASAKKDLREWEERHGYRKTGGKDYINEVEAEAKEDGYDTHHSASQSPLIHERKNSSRSMLPTLDNDRDRDVPRYKKSIHPWSDQTDKVESSATRTSSSVISPEQQKLMQEIAAIRQSINVLQTVAPSIDGLQSSTEQTTLAEPLSAARSEKPKWEQPRAEKVKSRIEFSARSSTSPWITQDRPRSKSVSNPPRIDEPFKTSSSEEEMPSTRPQPFLSIEIPSSTTTKSQEQSGFNRFRSSSNADYIEKSPLARPQTAMSQNSRFTSLDMSKRYDSREQRNYFTSPPIQSQKMEGFYTPKDVYRTYQSDTGSEVGEMIRFDGRRNTPPLPRSSSSQGFQTRDSRPLSPPTPKKKASLSIEELQARHQYLLKSKQTPTSARFEEEVALKKAQEEWQMKKKLEKRYWQEREKQTSKRNPAMSTPATPYDHHHHHPKSPSTTSRLDAIPSQSGVSRAKEWRRSLIIDGDSDKLIKNQRRHSSQIQPLLDFTAETLQQQGKNKLIGL